MRKKLILLTIFMLLGINGSVFAQIDEENEGPEPPPQAPIGQFVPILLAAGTVVAFKKLKSIQNE